MIYIDRIDQASCYMLPAWQLTEAPYLKPTTARQSD